MVTYTYHHKNQYRGRFVALDIAKGLKYLHEELKMVHMDIKSPNGAPTVAVTGCYHLCQNSVVDGGQCGQGG